MQLPSNHPRFFSVTPIDGDRAIIEGNELQHMAKVMRLKPGDTVALFDGSGMEFEATIDSIDRSSAQLDIVSATEVDRELPFELVVGVALPKGDRQQWLVEKCVELGVTQLVPLSTTRGVAQPKDKALQRLERWVVSASKQCRRNRLMQVAEANTVSPPCQSRRS